MVGCPFRSNGSAVLFKVRQGPLSDQERWAKRLLDIGVAGLGLVAVAPLLLLVAAAIAMETPGPILFKQTRLGFNGVPFKIRKFRSMTVTEDGPTVQAAKRHDARVTRVGRIIRRCSIDELPQLINVLRGEMSIVGPRPHALAHDQAYDRTVADYAHRQHVKPGLTGWAQINGHRGEIHNPTEMARRLDYDLWYIRNWRLSLDLKIILLTAGALVFTKKAY
jgi:putative colanic acid biosynthesis UDP-glucose lipid carrier transferase